MLCCELMLRPTLAESGGTAEPATPTLKPVWERWLPPLLLIITLLFWAGFMALVLNDARLNADASGTVVAVFPRAKTPETIFTDVLAADGRLVRNTWFDNVWVLHSDRPGFVGRLEASGALAAYSPVPFQPVALGGCFLTPGRLADSASPSAIRP